MNTAYLFLINERSRKLVNNLDHRFYVTAKWPILFCLKAQLYALKISSSNTGSYTISRRHSIAVSQCSPTYNIHIVPSKDSADTGNTDFLLSNTCLNSTVQWKDNLRISASSSLG
jgi:hypothetical protein